MNWSPLGCMNMEAAAELFVRRYMYTARPMPSQSGPGLFGRLAAAARVTVVSAPPRSGDSLETWHADQGRQHE